MICSSINFSYYVKPFLLYPQQQSCRDKENAILILGSKVKVWSFDCILFLCCFFFFFFFLGGGVKMSNIKDKFVICILQCFCTIIILPFDMI